MELIGIEALLIRKMTKASRKWVRALESDIR